MLVELDKEELQARVREARATLLSAQAALERTEVEARGHRPALPEVGAWSARASCSRDGLIAPSRARGRREGTTRWRSTSRRAAKSNVAVNRAEVARAQARARARRDRPAELHDHEPDGRHRALARRRGGRRRQLDPGARLAGDAGDDAGRRERACTCSARWTRPTSARSTWPARAHRGRVLQGQEVRGQGHQDLAARRREGQRHDLRGAGLDPEPGRRAQGQHERERRDHPRGEEGRAAGARGRRHLRQGRARRSWRCPTRRARTASARWPPSSASRTA